MQGRLKKHLTVMHHALKIIKFCMQILIQIVANYDIVGPPEARQSI